jgi:hypothetical protein
VSPITPKRLGTTWLASQPAINPTTIQASNDIGSMICVSFSCSPHPTLNAVKMNFAISVVRVSWGLCLMGERCLPLVQDLHQDSTRTIKLKLECRIHERVNIIAIEIG